MDLASMAVTAIIGYFKGSTLEQKIKEKAKAVYEAVKKALKEEKPLKRVEKNPDEPDSQAGLRAELRDLLEEDATFRAELERLLATDEGQELVNTVQNTINIQGDQSGTINQVGGDQFNAGRDQHINK